MTKQMTEKTVNEGITKAFHLFEDSHRRKITFDDLKRVSIELGEKISENELIEEADVNGDHAVNCQEILQTMKKTSLYWLKTCK